MHLHEQIQQQVATWRQGGYTCPAHPAIVDILHYAVPPEENGARRFLRGAQLRALETYWYLRLIEQTPRTGELYARLFPDPAARRHALGIPHAARPAGTSAATMDALWERIRTDADFVHRHKLQTVREMLLLAYPSYIFALTMGAGKTVLIGAIIATEFALALEYHPDAPGPFIQNALVFAPGLTILESLRELAEIDYAQILPPHLHRPFSAAYKLIFTRDGQRDIPAIHGSRYNIIVTNTEKIRIQQRTRRHHAWTALQYAHKQAQAEEEANLRLQTIASLPNLGVFSDEAHHTYGRAVDKRLKRVRQTVDYLHAQTNLVAVVNTTGTPYHKRQPLPEVVMWYGLAQGIADNILKPVDDSIVAYDTADTAHFVTAVVTDFFENYSDVTLPNGAPARLAIYFPHNRDLDAMRPVIERTLLQIGYASSIVLRNTNRSTAAELDAFARLNQPDAPHRVILLVNKGTEGWNCPSLFACALARTLTDSRNFVLQASTRCLRQVPGNPHHARIYLSRDNLRILERQLRDTYGECVERLRSTTVSGAVKDRAGQIRLGQTPPTVGQNKGVVSATTSAPPRRLTANERHRIVSLHLTQPDRAHSAPTTRQTYALRPDAGTLAAQGTTMLETVAATTGRDLYSAAVLLATTYRLDVWPVYDALRSVYDAGDTTPPVVPDSHLPALAAQIEQQMPAAEPLNRSNRA